MELIKIEKLGEYKKAAKAFIRGAIKAKIFNDAKNAINVTVTKDFENTVGVEIANGAYTANFDAEVSTRVYNKVDAELFNAITKQFNTLKNFGGVKVDVKSLATTKK